MIILRTPKGWTGPKEVDGHKVEGFWRAHQMPILDPVDQPEASEDSRKPGCAATSRKSCSTRSGTLIAELQRDGAEGHAAHHRESACEWRPAAQAAASCRTFATMRSRWRSPGRSRFRRPMSLAHFLRDVMRQNMTSFRVFGPDETASNKLDGDLRGQPARRGWRRCCPRMRTAAISAPDGRVMEMLSEHTLEGWFEGYVLTGRHGLFSTYEAFVHIIDSMFNQHAKWLEKSKLETALAGADLFDQPADHLAGVAAGPQRLHPSGPGISRCGDQQEPGGDADLSAAGCELPAERGATIACAARTTST